MTGCDLKSEKEGYHQFYLFPDNLKVWIQKKSSDPKLDDSFSLLLKYIKTKNPKLLKSIQHEATNDGEQYIFVCCHQNLDARCGYCGPKLVSLFENKISAQNKKNITISKTSHIGGHKYAGNVILFPPGDWFGNVTPNEIDSLFELYFDNIDSSRKPTLIEVLKPHFRGSMQPSESSFTS